MARSLIWAGILLIIMGILWNRIPGNIEIKGKDWTFYFPFGICIVISVVGSLLLWLFSKR